MAVRNALSGVRRFLVEELPAIARDAHLIRQCIPKVMDKVDGAAAQCCQRGMDKLIQSLSQGIECQWFK